MMAEPLLTAVTLPEEDTLATFVLEEDQVTALLDALEGDTVALSCLEAPFFVSVKAP